MEPITQFTFLEKVLIIWSVMCFTAAITALIFTLIWLKDINKTNEEIKEEIKRKVYEEKKK